ncbi:hypothetical protein [Zoogloea sp.]|uniref:hypothetical protein n=1 Tax=Zoogloea sp. TaxID=49181 RepID=UPI0026024135|nr:hypothetical protein [Zoogloea sp.]MDD3355123.1 hypothetical protein [Zoogloea sp.]
MIVSVEGKRGKDFTLKPPGAAHFLSTERNPLRQKQLPPAHTAFPHPYPQPVGKTFHPSRQNNLLFLEICFKKTLG